MTQRQDAILGFGLMMVSAAAIPATMGWQAVISFAFGVITTLVAAAVVSTSFD